MRLALAAVLLASVTHAQAGALRHAALAVMTVRENPTAEGRRTALDVAFDGANDGATLAEVDTSPTSARVAPRNWFPKKPAALPQERTRLRVPELPAAAAGPGFAQRAAAAFGAAFAPWRALADAAWGGTWTGMVAVGLAGDPH